MPVYNGSLYLQRSIGSVMAQTYANWQLVALDDGSTDDSLSVLKQMAAADKRIKIMTKTNDGKGNTARNIDIMSAEAEGDYIFYMSQDDYISADLLQHAVTRIEETGQRLSFRTCCSPMPTAQPSRRRVRFHPMATTLSYSRA